MKLNITVELTYKLQVTPFGIAMGFTNENLPLFLNKGLIAINENTLRVYGKLTFDDVSVYEELVGQSLTYLKSGNNQEVTENISNFLFKINTFPIAMIDLMDKKEIHQFH